MQVRLHVVEGVPFFIESAMQDALRKTLFRLRREMRLSFPPLKEDEAGFTISNLIGSIDIGMAIIDVTPKTEPEEEWITSILSLLFGSDTVDAAGERAAGFSRSRTDVIEALGIAYASRLRRALRRDGPILQMSRDKRTAGFLRGKLVVGEWVQSAWSNPSRFPQEYALLDADNEFARALAFVAAMFARVARLQDTRFKLLDSIALLRPGLPSVSIAPKGIEHLDLPQQWSAYQPAWSIAAAMLARRSLLGPQGSRAGISIAIEPWPLLERLLERSLENAVQQGCAAGRKLKSAAQSDHTILRRFLGPAREDHFVRPDGILIEDDATLATFEAKYRAYSREGGPLRSEIYQALAAARACSSPLAVLVYPGRFDPAYWCVCKAGATPSCLAAIGLDMFSYRTGEDASRGKLLLRLVEGALQPDPKATMLAK